MAHTTEGHAKRRGADEQRIRYTVAACPLGRLLVAATHAGICAVALGDADGTLEAELRAAHPAARLERDGGVLGEWTAPLLAHLQGRLRDLDLPLDVSGSAFQRQVWQHLRDIPYGSTRAYGEIARALALPGGATAARAVARACATNPVALVIPCHRAVGQDGALTGYRWGLERKRALLARERQVAGEPVQLSFPPA